MLGCGVLLLTSRWLARSMPVVRQASVALPDWPAGAPPIRVALLSDIHIGNAAMDGTRLERIVDRVAAQHPDLVLIAGDLIAGASAETAVRVAPAIIAAFGRLRPPLGTIAVFGNHDVRTDREIVRRTLERAGVTVLQNSAIARGPLAVAGVGDVVTGQQDVAATWRQLRRLPGARIALTHSPEGIAGFPADAHLVLAGHTHCGQVVLPIFGTLDRIERMRYWCGLYRDGARTVVVTAGLGTTGYTVRFGAPPDIWMLTLTPGRR
jgi:predicted MPP superfamily phosphohydrolase